MRSGIVSKQRYKGTWNLVEPVIDAALTDFYTTATADEAMRPLLAGQSTDRLKAAQIRHWELTFTHGFDADYRLRLQRIGQAHARVGLRPEVFCAGYGILLRSLLSHARRRHWLRLNVALDVAETAVGAVFSDLALGIGFYRAAIEDAQGKANESVANGARTFSHRMHEIDGEMRSIVVAVEEMDASIGDITANVDRTSAYAREAAEEAARAVQAVDALSSTSEAIGSFLDMITKIADQTKLLSLNAAIEAARAGEAGRGFSVVAEEVRNLAAGTERNAKDVSAKLSEIQDVAKNIRAGVERVRASFGQVLAAAQQIAVAMHQQKEVTGEMSLRMDGIKGTVEEQLLDLARLVERLGSTGDGSADGARASAPVGRRA